MIYPVSERFKAPQGEGLYTGVPMAFIRFVGCSVGKSICTSCDTDFEAIHAHLGGGKYSPEELVSWVGDFREVCLTGGEPLDRDLQPMIQALGTNHRAHIETSGTKLLTKEAYFAYTRHGGCDPFITVSPKPGWLPAMIELADEIKVIHCGLGDADGWPSIAQAIAWADAGKLVYLQPRNDKLYINDGAMVEAIREVMRHPQLRLSAQLHKYIRTR